MDHPAKQASLDELVEGVIRIQLHPAELSEHYPIILDEYEEMHQQLLQNLYWRYKKAFPEELRKAILSISTPSVLDNIMNPNSKGY